MAKRFPAIVRPWLKAFSRGPTYSNEEFDLVQAVAMALTDEDRLHHRPAPPVGYSEKNVRIAKRTVKMLRNTRMRRSR
jgi:hypothetical protein